MRLFGLVGYPLSHSFSQAYYREKFLQEKIDDAEFLLFPIQSLRELPTFIRQNSSLSGLCLTIPYKEKIIPYLNNITKEAQKIGAVNCVKITRLGASIELIGHNTDVWGFNHLLKEEPILPHSNALVFGTGGAAKAVAFVLDSLEISYRFVSRTGTERCINYQELSPSVLQKYSTLINCTPIGMYPNVDTLLPIPYHALTPQHYLIDLIYNPLESSFLKEGKKRGCRIKNGLSMLHSQADANWEIWNQQ